MKIRTFHPDINKFCRALFSGMSCGGFCGTFRNLWPITSSPVTEKSQPKCDFFFDFG